MKKAVTLAVVVCLGAFGSYMVYHEAQEYKAAEAAAAEAVLPDWYETDSSKAIARRTAADFSLSRLEILEAIQRQHPEVTDADLDTFVARHYIESMNIDTASRRATSTCSTRNTPRKKAVATRRHKTATPTSTPFFLFIAAKTTRG